jgi:DNA polymerase-3 subunit alpha
MPAEFTHLHLHTDYSLLDGACDVEKLVKHVHSLGQTAVATTDHGNIFGAVHFFNAAKEHGIKPILGANSTSARKRTIAPSPIPT